MKGSPYVSITVAVFGTVAAAVLIGGGAIWWIDGELSPHTVDMLALSFIFFVAFLYPLFLWAVYSGRRDRRIQQQKLNDMWHERASEEY